jgi:hypothetical protein
MEAESEPVTIEGLLADISDGVQQALTSYGWIKGSIGSEERGMCLWGAWQKATGKAESWDEMQAASTLNFAFRESARKVISELYPVHHAYTIEGFNDHVMTTEEDVRLMAKHAIMGIADLIEVPPQVPDHG